MVSKAKLENVVNAPQNPTTINNRQRGSSSTRSVLQIMKNPTMKLPLMLMKRVPQGKTGPTNFAPQRLISQRKLAPNTAPIEIMSTSFKLRKVEFSLPGGRSYQRALGGRLWRTPSP